MPGYADWLMGPIREDARAGHMLNEAFGPGDLIFDSWNIEEQQLYMDIEFEDLKACYDQWVAYFKAHPEECIGPDDDDDIPF